VGADHPLRRHRGGGGSRTAAGTRCSAATTTASSTWPRPHLEGEADHLLLRGVHTTLPWRADVAAYVVRFLETGGFATIDP
jgi:hypothetical protein